MSSVDRTLAKISILLGITVGLVGISFGMLSTAAGVPIVLTCACSMLVFAGGSQFAALGVVAGGGSALAALVSGLFLNARFIAFGVAVAPRLRGGVVRRAMAAHFLVDESAAVALGQPSPELADRAFWWSGLVMFVTWNAGTVAGAVGGTMLGDPRVLGLDAALPAAMLALLWSHLSDRRGRWVAGVGAAIAGVAMFVAPAGVAILASCAAVAVVWLLPETSNHGDAT